jgi:hypothetical protein
MALIACPNFSRSNVEAFAWQGPSATRSAVLRDELGDSTILASSPSHPCGGAVSAQKSCDEMIQLHRR